MSDEPGRHTDEDGRIVYAWPPKGRFRELWDRVDAITSKEEKHELLSLLLLWRDEGSSVVGIVHEDGTYEDLEPDWEKFKKFWSPNPFDA